MMEKFYQPPHFNFNDFDLIVKDGVLYAAYVKKIPYSGKDLDSKKPNRWGLAASKDGIHWKEVKDILHPVKNSWEESLWAGCVSKQGNRYVAYYTAILSKERESSCEIGKAYSSDLMKWRKDPNNPLLTFDAKNPFYSDEPKLAFRDPFHFSYKRKHYILMCTKDKAKPKNKKGCIGLFEEYKKNKFKWLPPLFSPGRYCALECPALYFIQKRWYLIYGDDEKGVFRYALADHPFGPYEEPKNNILHTKLSYVSRIVQFKGKYLMYWWIRDFPRGLIRERLTGPKEVNITKKGEIKLAEI